MSLQIYPTMNPPPPPPPPSVQYINMSNANTLQPKSNQMVVDMPTPMFSPMPKREWTNGICNCFNDCGDCFCAFFFPLCASCMLFSRAGEPCCSCIYGGLVPLRTKIRTQRNIQGDICCDFCVVYWCGSCALAQMMTEVKATPPLI